MKKHAKQILIWIVTVALIFGCFSGTGLTVKAAEGLASIASVKLASDTVPARGGTMELTVTGSNLTDNNWGIEITRYYSGTKTEVSENAKAGKATVSKITATGATIEFSATGMSSPIDFEFSVGPKDGDSITPQASICVTQEGKNYSTETIDVKSVEMADNCTIVATFRSEIEAVEEGEALKKLIYVASADGITNRYDLGADDTVTVEGNTVTVKYANSLDNISETSKLYIKEGALKAVGSDKLAADISWIITSAARISSIELDKDVFDNNGGTVTATLKGYRADTIDLSLIEAGVYLPGDTTASVIEVKKERNGEGNPILIFDVPKNETQNTISYWLNVKFDGTPVYESAADSRGERATISVLPEGKTDKDVTLSEVTISGNNKNEDETANVKNITVNVSNNIGELKTELRVYGTNLDSSLTKVRAVDENNIVWPVYQISECDGTWRFIAIAGPHRNGVFGDGNSQLIELLPPRYAGTNKTYRIQVALDGKNFIEEPCVTLTVNNAGISGEPDFRDCTANNFKYVTVKYVDESGKEIAEKDVYKGYCLSMPEGFGIAPKEIAGYKLIKEPKLDEWVDEGRTYQYVYRSTSASGQTTAVKAQSVAVNAVSKQIAAGKKVQMSATVAPANTTNKAVTWSSSNKKYATVNAAGKVTFKKAGAGKYVTITATAADGSGKKGSVKVKIMKHAVKSVKLKAAKTVKAGKKVKVKATVKTTGKKVNKKLKWTSSNTKYATVSSKGVVKTKKAGKGKTVKITATSTDGSNKKKTVKIKIK